LYYTASGVITPIGVMTPEAYFKAYCKTKFCASSWLITKFISIYFNKLIVKQNFLHQVG